LPCLILLAGCPKKGDAGDAAAEAAPSASAAASASAGPAEPTAKNSADIARFPSETKIANEAAKTAMPVAARTGPKGGNVVAMLKPGTDVTKIADHQDCFLVTFADPKDSSSTLMGWIEKSSFTYVAPHDAGAKDAAAVDAGPPKCATTEELVTLSASTTACKKKCKEDKECKTAPCAVASTPSGKATKVCTND